MATNASTWFYSEPEHSAFLIEERVNHTFWQNRIMGLTLTCSNVEPPFAMSGVWRDMPLEISWVPKSYFTLTAAPSTDTDHLIVGLKEILGFNPTISYIDTAGKLVAEWHVKEVAERIQEIQGNPNYRQIKRYK